MKRKNHSKSVGVRSAFFGKIFMCFTYSSFLKFISYIVCVWNSFPLVNSEHSTIIEKLVFM